MILYVICHRELTGLSKIVHTLQRYDDFLTVEGFYKNVWECIAAVCFIALFPILAYPLSVVIPPFKGRDGQRNLAFIMCNVGYILGVLYAIIFKAGKPVTVMLITYLLSGVTLLLINKLFRFKASGHGCGLVGPLAALVYFVNIWCLPFGITLAALALLSFIFPDTMMIGAMARYVSEGGDADFQPMNANFGLVRRHDQKIKGGKKVRYQFYAERALSETERILKEEEL